MAEEVSFNQEPMIVVVSNSLDPRVVRQIKAQMQAKVVDRIELEAELEKQKAAEHVKKIDDNVSKNPKFDEDETENTPPPKPIEEAKSEEDGKATEGDGDGSDDADLFGVSDNEGTTGENTNAAPDKTQEANPQQNNTNQPADNSQQPQQATAPAQPTDNGNTNQPPAQNATAANNDSQQNQPQQNQPQQNPPANQANTANTNAGQTPPNNQGNQPQNGSGNQAAQPSDNGSGNQQEADDAELFSEKTAFESFARVLGYNYKTEDANQETGPDLPPMKIIAYIRGSDLGVNSKVSATVATYEDPANTVLVLDMTDVSDVEAQMQFKTLKRSCQERGMTVFEDVEAAIEYLNTIYDELKK